MIGVQEFYEKRQQSAWFQSLNETATTNRDSPQLDFKRSVVSDTKLLVVEQDLLSMIYDMVFNLRPFVRRLINTLLVYDICF